MSCAPAVAAVLLLAMAAGAGDRPKPAGGLAAVVRAEFAKWDADGDGKLTVAEVDRAVLDPEVKGPAAAALAVIKAIERENTDAENRTPPLTLAIVAKYEADRAAGKVDGDDDYDAWFREYADKLRRTSRELFPQ